MTNQAGTTCILGNRILSLLFNIVQHFLKNLLVSVINYIFALRNNIKYSLIFFSLALILTNLSVSGLSFTIQKSHAQESNCNPNAVTIRVGSTGQDVQNLQNILLKLGYDIGGLQLMVTLDQQLNLQLNNSNNVVD